MRILLVSHFIPFPPHGGSAQRNYNLQRELARDHTLDVVTFWERQFHPLEEDRQRALDGMKGIWSDTTLLAVRSDATRIGWYSLLFLNLFSRTPFNVWRFRSKTMTRSIRERVRTQRYDLVYFDTIVLAQYLDCAGPIPAILNHHNVESSLLLRRGKTEKNPVMRFYARQQGLKTREYERRAAPRFRRNVTVSELDAAELQGFCGDIRTCVVDNGTDTEYFTPSPTPSGGSEMIYTGGMTWYPNRDAMLYFAAEIFPRIRVLQADAGMTVIGRNPPQELLRLASEDPGFRVSGFVDDVRPAVRGASVYVVPIRVGGGTRLKLLDAMAQGKAIVSTTIGCEGIPVTDGENVLIADEPEPFAAAVVRIMRDAELRHRLERNARRFVEENYSWHAIGRRQSALYEEALRGGASR